MIERGTVSCARVCVAQQLSNNRKAHSTRPRVPLGGHHDLGTGYVDDPIQARAGQGLRAGARMSRCLGIALRR
jgi:hypothetical protein